MDIGIEKTIEVAYGDFVDGIKAQADLSNIRAMIMSGASIVSDDIRAILGIDSEDIKKIDRKIIDESYYWDLIGYKRKCMEYEQNREQNVG